MGTQVLVVVLVLVAVAVTVVVALTLSKLFQRTTKGLAFVKTGFGGEKVIMDGGAIILPLLHEISWVCMKTRKIIIGRTQRSALITNDKFRVDVEAEFYLRIKQDENSVSAAAQSLGEGAMNDEILKSLMEGKFVDALRAAAAAMDMNELHEKRSEFVQAVQINVQEELMKNGLELESVALISLDQTSIEYLDENNAFDAEGLTKLAKITEDRKKTRNAIEQDNRIEIETRNLDAEKKSLALKKEEELTIAEQDKEIAVAQAERDRESKEAQIESERSIEEARIASEEAVKAADIARDKNIEAAEIEKAKVIEEAKIEKSKTLEIAVQQKNVEVYEKSQEESEAQTLANEKRAEAVAAEERITTASETEVANREKNIAIIEATQEAEVAATAVRVQADAEKDAAKDRATAITVAAEANAESIEINAAAQLKSGLAEAEAMTAINEAQNTLSPEIQQMNITMETVRSAPAILEAMMKPVEAIDDFKVVNVNGLGGNGLAPAAGGNGGNGGTGNFASDMMNSLMQYKTTMPLVDNILGSAGIELGNGPAEMFSALGATAAKIAEAPIAEDVPVTEAPAVEAPAFTALEEIAEETAEEPAVTIEPCSMEDIVAAAPKE